MVQKFLQLLLLHFSNPNWYNFFIQWIGLFFNYFTCHNSSKLFISKFLSKRNRLTCKSGTIPDSDPVLYQTRSKMNVGEHSELKVCQEVHPLWWPAGLPGGLPEKTWDILFPAKNNTKYVITLLRRNYDGLPFPLFSAFPPCVCH